MREQFFQSYCLFPGEIRTIRSISKKGWPEKEKEGALKILKSVFDRGEYIKKSRKKIRSVLFDQNNLTKGVIDIETFEKYQYRPKKSINEVQKRIKENRERNMV